MGRVAESSGTRTAPPAPESRRQCESYRSVAPDRAAASLGSYDTCASSCTRRPGARRRVAFMRLSTVILPIHRWSEGQKLWRRAEELGFHAAYTYDHLSWRSFRDEPWFGAVPTLTAAATATERLRLGTLVTSVKPRSHITA